MFQTRFDHQLKAHQQAHLIRQRQIRPASDGPVSFCDNDYLGFSRHPKVIEATEQTLLQYGVGSTGSAHVTGYTDVHQQLEQCFAETFGFERALLFGNGYLANLAVPATLCQKSDRILQDKLCHASILDGGSLSPAQRVRYRHRDMGHLAELLEASSQQTVIITDSVFSMDGDITPLPRLVDLAKQHQSLLMIDEAHSLGVLGEGFGSYVHFHLQPQINHIAIYPLGKAIGSYGAVVCSSKAIIDTLVQFARPYMYNTGLPPMLAAASLQSLQLLKTEPWHVTALQQNIDYFRQCATDLNLPISNSDTAIQPLIVGNAEAALNVSRYLQQHQIHVTAIRPPTIAKGTSRLRITLSSRHRKQDIDQLLEKLSNALAYYGN